MADEPRNIVHSLYQAIRRGDVAAAEQLTADGFHIDDHAGGAESAANAADVALLESLWRRMGLQPEEYRLRHHRVVVPVVLQEPSGHRRLEYHVWDIEDGVATRLRVYAGEREAENAAESVG